MDQVQELINADERYA